MPRNQEAIRRYRIIHNILRRGGKHKSSKIAEVCRETGIHAEQRTIQKDLQDLREDPTLLGKCLPIEKDNKTKTWYYSEIPKDIFPVLELEDDEINALLFYAKAVDQYSDYPIFNKITNAIEKVIDSSNISSEIRILFDTEGYLRTEKHEPIRGIELITSFLQSIQKRRVLKLNYQKFEGDIVREHIIRPILLKEDKHLWYLIGESVTRNKIITLALDRIKDFTETTDTYDEVRFDHDNYYKFSFGITVPDEEPVDVTIRFSASQGNYVKTLPIHSPHDILEDSKKYFTIRIRVKPSYEFYSKILSYGSDATVISPEWVKEEILQILKRSISHYKSVS